jgi:hypothetical protein
MTITNKHQAEAILECGEGILEYTHGVLACLGLGDLRRSLIVQSRNLNWLVAEREKLGASSGDFWADQAADMANPEWVKASDTVESANQRYRKTWADVEALKSQARDFLGALDPLGYGQAV